jgi:hypothetical protein
VYTSGKSKLQQQNARKFLEEINVREVGEAEQVEAILKQRYTNAHFQPLRKDLQRFIALVEADSNKASLFANYFIFELKDGKWGTPSQVFLDQPFKDTGLRFYYDAIDNPRRFPLSARYEAGQIPLTRLAKFAEAVGAQIQLGIEAVSCSSNPDWEYLQSVGGNRETSPINRDYVIPGLEDLLANPTLEIVRLVWRTMASLLQNSPYLQATYRKNETWGSHHADSQLVHQLRSSAWVPQRDGLFVPPCEASRDLLPEGFAFDPGWSWLKAIQFGTCAFKKSEEQRQKQEFAKELGFIDTASLERAQRFAALPAEEQERILTDQECKAATELPEHESNNPERRAERVGSRAITAPQRQTEERSRSISVALEKVKQEAAQYLLSQYTNSDGDMICQACKGSLPFKLDDGTTYFEKVEFLADLKRRHYQNYLALCPNHAAMFLYANGSSESMKSAFLEMTTNELGLILAQKSTTIYFTKTHIVDLKAVIQAETSDQFESDANNTTCALNLGPSGGSNNSARPRVPGDGHRQ